MDTDLQTLANKNIRDILTLSIKHAPPSRALVVYDTENGLTDIITAAYRAALPDAEFVDFNTKTKEEIIGKFNALSPGDLVVLIQTSSFRLDAFRIRLHLFQRKLKVIEHMHLYRNSPDVWDVYINALAYDPSWYLDVGPKLQRKITDCERLDIRSGENILTITGGLEPGKPNLGDYTGMENIGGTFPIGEVFTEARDFSKMNGSILIYAFAGNDFCVNMHEPFRIDIREGLVVGWQDDAPPAFIEIAEAVRAHERPLIREVGFGLNRAITKERYLQDITAFERILGLHLSFGEKHSVFKKAGITSDKSKFHVDLFPVADKVTMDGTEIFKDGIYIV
jgi:hypothetical protein